jgi:hypothetical protein
VTGVPETYEQRVLAPVLAINGHAAVSHRSAARILELRGNARYGGIDITTTRTTGARIAKARVHRSAIFDRHDTVGTRTGIPVTRPERTVIGVGALMPEAAGRVIDAAIHAGFTTYDRLWLYLERYSGKGCPGAAAVKAELLRRDPRERPAESTLEDDWIDTLATRGVTGLVKQHTVMTEEGEKRIDLAAPWRMVGLEFDSKLWHVSEEDYRRDRRKRYLLTRAGYRIYPVTEFDRVERPDEIAADLKRELGIAA